MNNDARLWYQAGRLMQQKILLSEYSMCLCAKMVICNKSTNIHIKIHNTSHKTAYCLMNSLEYKGNN